MRLSLVALLLSSLVAVPGPPAVPGGDVPRSVSAPAWEYHFPPGLLDSLNLVVTPDHRYLAIASARRRYHPVGRPEQTTAEGENAVYLFDLHARRLLWKQVFPEGLVAAVLGVTPGGEFVAVELGTDWPGQTGGGVQTLGVPERGARLYDSTGHLAARRLPLERTGGRWHHEPVVLRAPQDQEEPVPEALRARLTEAGVGDASTAPPPDPIVRRSRNGAPCIVGLNPDGTVKWEWRVPPEEDTSDSWHVPIVLSEDGQTALVTYLVVTPGSPGRRRRFHLLRWADGWKWTRELPREVPELLTWRVSNGGASALVYRGLADRQAVDILGPDGETKASLAFQGVGPGGDDLSPNGAYWAVALGRRTWGPGVDDMGWTEGMHVFDCATGKVLWRSPAVASAQEVLALDSGGVVTVSLKTHTLSVFDPPR